MGTKQEFYRSRGLVQEEWEPLAFVTGRRICESRSIDHGPSNSQFDRLFSWTSSTPSIGTFFPLMLESCQVSAEYDGSIKVALRKLLPTPFVLQVYYAPIRHIP